MKKHLVLIGGGHAHALLLKQFREQPIAGVHLTVVEPQSKAPYTGMLPGYIAGHYTRDELYIDIQKLCDHDQITFIQDRVTGAVSDKNYVTLGSGERLDYDYVSYDVGIHANLLAVPGFAEHAVAVKPLGVFADRWMQFVTSEDDDKKVVVIGGGVAGVEVALAMQYALSRQRQQYSVTVIDSREMLERVSSATRAFVMKQLDKAGIATVNHSLVRGIDGESVQLENGIVLQADLVLGSAGARPYKWLQETGLQCELGYVVVNQYLQSASHSNAFAVGDCAHFKPHPLEKAGVYAVRQAPFLYKNIKAIVADENMLEFVPQKDYLKLVSLGEQKAVADKWGVCIHGRLLWKLKNYIDQKFMQQFEK